MGTQRTFIRGKDGNRRVVNGWSKDRPIHYSLLIKIFELDGFAIRRKKGDHVIMTKLGVKRPLVIKTSPKLVPVTHIRTNMTTAGMSRKIL